MKGLANIEYNDAKYLKAYGKSVDVKVSLVIVDKVVRLNIRDCSFLDFNAARKYLKFISDSELTKGE